MYLCKKYIFWFFLVLLSCNFNPDKKVTPAWEMDFLGPLVKADLNIQNIAHISDMSASKSLSMSDFGQASAGLPISAFGPVTLPSYTLNFTSAFNRANLSSGDLSFKITDGLEIDIKAGAKIIIDDGATNIVTQALPAINRLGGVYTSPITSLTGKSIGANLTLSVQNFSSNGTSGQSFPADASRKLRIDIFLKNVLVNSITLSNVNSFAIADTSDFRLQEQVFLLNR
jgi:hypothetical protein